ncbi:MAG: class I SAM-dependent methyltransferase [Chitinophagaceae bacterium]|nr:MAG: class I SAM-dependent methyltransferase [Chitinophagaceae bacterium]
MIPPNNFITSPIKILHIGNSEINIFNTNGKNLDQVVIDDFGEEWKKFNNFEDPIIQKLGDGYFDIIDDDIVNSQTYCLDVGCGTGRWSKYLAQRAGFIEAIDPSDSILAAGKLLEGIKNIRLSRSAIDTLPFADNSFDFAMSVGVLHHIPDTQQALNDCVKKVKAGGYLYIYLYYTLDNRSLLFKFIFHLSNIIRRVTSKLPGRFKRIVCDILAIIVYMPFILICRLFVWAGFEKLAGRIPLYAYHDKGFLIIRNDALDRFGTRLEKRFSRDQIIEMMEIAGLTDIVVSPNLPYYHAVGRKKEFELNQSSESPLNYPTAG